MKRFLFFLAPALVPALSCGPCHGEEDRPVEMMSITDRDAERILRNLPPL
jgi:hypothetical protein